MMMKMRKQVMIKYIIHTADIHIKGLQRHEENREILSNFLNDIKPFMKEHCDETRIVVAGDLFDQKLNITSESQIFLSWFFRELDNMGTTFYIAGNHDFTQANTSRVDAITPIFKMNQFNNVSYLDMITDYKSGFIEDDDVIWALYSLFDNYAEPNIEKIKEDYPNHKIIGLCHGPIVGSKTDLGFTIDRGIDSSIFKGCDYVLLGDIHKRQLLTSKDGIPMYYPGSLSQLNFGETIDNHGYSIITLPEFTIEHHEVENPYKYYTFVIEDPKDQTYNGLIN
jgi:DNA repair exonuclease SbcCD nuclease subunit